MMIRILTIIAFMFIGMISYAQFPVLVQDETVIEIVTSEQDWHLQDSVSRVYVMSMWIQGNPAEACKPHIAKMKQSTVKWFYKSINTSINYAMQLMRGEVLITPATYNEEGEIEDEAVYNTIPKNQIALRDDIRKVYKDFYDSEVDYYIYYFIIYSGCGDWSTFKNTFE